MLTLRYTETCGKDAAFKNRPLSSWPLLTYISLPDQLTGDVTIVGYDKQQPKRTISHKNITTQRYMKAHVRNNSRPGDQDILPFYFPTPHVSGPDIIFLVDCFCPMSRRHLQLSAAMPFKGRWKRSRRSNKNCGNRNRQQASHPINSNQATLLGVEGRDVDGCILVLCVYLSKATLIGGSTVAHHHNYRTTAPQGHISAW